jgi:hypothetical protein
METNKNKTTKGKEETPAWLKSIQLNSWEAELLISALFLYILFQIPEILFTYRKVHLNSGEFFYRLIGFFEEAIVVLSIGYVVHIITRGIWVANIGLSYVFPRGVDVKKIGLKGKFRKEVENQESMDYSVLLLERIASMTYAISFMSSGLVLSIGTVLLTIMRYIDWVITPALKSGMNWLYMLAVLGLFIYALVLILVFIDFITNGFFRRDSWASKPYYYIVMVFRVLTLSFVYNRMLLVIISNLPKWKAHLVPVAFVVFLGLYFFIGSYMEGQQVDDYYESSFDNMRYENYENLRHKDSKIFVTIQSDIVDKGVVKLFVNNFDDFSELHQKDPKRIKDWKALSVNEKTTLVNDFLSVEIDDSRMKNLNWNRYKNPSIFDYGYLSYVDIASLEHGEHIMTVRLDTVNMTEKQRSYLRELSPSTIVKARIPFYKTD